MSETSEVRLVRCPKCENLLQEPSEFSVYQCGGCGTVLRAKKNGFVDNGDLDVSGNEKGMDVPDKVDDNASALKDDFSKKEKAKEGIVTEEEAMDKIVDEISTLNSNNPSLLDNSGAAMDLDLAARLAKRMALTSDQNRKIGTSNDRLRHSPDVQNGNRVQDSSNSSYNANGTAYNHSNEFMFLEGSTRSRPIVNSRHVDRSRIVSSLSNANDNIAGKRDYVKFSYKDEGPSNLGLGSYGNYMEQTKYEDHLDRLARVEILENDRAELLRKLDELTDQLTRSCNVADLPKETRFHDRRMPSKQPIPTDHLSHGYTSYTGRNGSTFPESYPNMNHMQEYRGFSDVYHPHMPRRPPSCQLPLNKYLQKPCYEHFPAQYMDFNQDFYMPEPLETFHHKPMHPLYNNLYVPRKSQPNCQNDRNNYANNPSAYSRQVYVSEESNLPFLHPHERHPPLTRSSSDLGVESNGFGRWRLKMPSVTKNNRRVFHPIAGGAPFITCCNCSQVLKMSKKFLQTQEKQSKIKCEACSSVLLFEFEKKGVVLSVPPETDEVFVHVSAAKSTAQCNDFLNICSTDTSDESENRNVESNTGLGAEMSNSDAGEMGQAPHLFSSGDSEYEPSPDDVSLHLPDSPCDKYLDKPSSNKDQFFPDGKTSRQNSLKEAFVATEMDVSYDDNSRNDVDPHSSDANKDSSQPKINKGADSFFLGIIKKSFGEFSRSRNTTENRRSNVSVNGHFVPDRVVKKAEKLAGPIQPGDYWYDSRAGFWGVMGHPCLGIILPNIDEFNYLMPENCAGGNTGVFLNGRELHRKDLDLLASRGLPTTSDKSYLIEISGRVVDEDTGEELDLGKLAPTVEKAKHGFGMKVPKTIMKQ